MKKMMFVLALLLALTSFAGIVAADNVQAASPLDDLTALAAYAPADTAFFAAMRTDDAFLDELDVLIGRVAGNFPPEMRGEMPPCAIC